MVNEIQLIGITSVFSGCIILLLYLRLIQFLKGKFSFSWKDLIVGSLVMIASFSVVGVTYIIHQNLRWNPTSIAYLYLFEALILGIYIEFIRFFFFKFLVKGYDVEKGYTLGLGFMSPFLMLLIGGGVIGGINIILSPPGVGFSGNVWRDFIVTPLGLIEQLILQMFLSILILKTLKDFQCKNMIYAIGLHAFTDFVKRYGMGVIIYDLLPIRLMSPYQDPWFVPGIQTYLAEIVLLSTSVAILYYLVKQVREIV